MPHVTLAIHTPLWAAVLDCPDAVQEILWNTCSYTPVSAVRSPRFGRGGWDGRETLLRKGFFPTGLVPRVQAALERAGYVVAIKAPPYWDPLPNPSRFKWNDDSPGPLRPAQLDACLATIGPGRGVIAMATGSGKTEVLARLIADYGLPTLVVVPSKDILTQTVKRLKVRLPGIKIGVIGDGSYTWSREVTVITTTSLGRYRHELEEELQTVGLLLVDECHHVRAATVYAALMLCPAPYRFGFSATPYADRTKWITTRGERRELRLGDDLKLEAALGPCVYEYDGNDAEADGHLVPVTVWRLRLSADVEPVPETLDQQKDWAAIYEHGIAAHVERNDRLARITALVARQRGPTLVICRLIEHVATLVNRIADQGVTVRGISGESTRDTRQSALQGLAKGEYTTLVSSVILDEGVDVPAIANVILAAGGRADHKTIQRVGRGRRTGGPQDDLLVVDVIDTTHPVLDYHSTVRNDLYKRSGWETDVIGPDEQY